MKDRRLSHFGAFSDEKNAAKLAEELKKKGYSVIIVKG
ncbi:SPOR domain-containing protein [Peribacillus butanolivorans]|nr:SPOR domain-containing protein [Peribacillus butanolivorans]MED3691316.1 SPOR domain-containing protein [Peribacillus butanolivorans]